MFKKLFKNKPIGFYFSLAASLLSLFLTIFYAAYCGAHGLFNGGVFVFYLLAFLLPLVYFFIEENDLTRIIPILQTVFLSLAVGISIPTMGTEIVYYLTGSSNIAETTASGAVLIFIIAATLVTALVSLVACFMRQTKKLTAEQQAEVDEDWANFKTNTKEFAVKHKTPLIIGGAGAVVLIVFLIILFAVIIPAALVVHVDSVKFEQESVVMYETDKLRLEPIITPEDAENKNIIYTSSDESVIKIENGVAEALKAGEATITATAEDGDASATCNVEVKELTVTETTVAKMPNTVHYMYGANDEFKSSGVSIVAKLSSGKEQKITKGKHGLTFTADEKHMKDGEIIVNDKDVTITASYTFRDKPFSATFVVHGDAAEAGSFSEFGAALSNNNIGYVYMTDDFDAGTVKVTRNLGIEGNLNASAVEVSEGATLTMEDGRIQSGGDLAISGDGAIDASAFEVASVPLQDRREHAALFAEGSLTIDGTDVVCSNVAANDFTVRGGANVTVYGKNVSIKQQAGFGDFGMLGVNGIHLAGDLTVEGEGTVLNIMYNDIAFGSSPAAVETNGVTTVDGATLNIGSSEGCASWAYTIWSGSGDDFVAKNGAKVSLSMTNDTSCFWAVNSLEVLDGSEFTMSAPNYTNADIDAKFDKDAKVTVNGTVFDMTKPLEERAFGDMTATGEVTVSVDPDMLYFAGEKFTGEGISVNAEFSGGSSSGKLRVALDSGFVVTEIASLVEGDNTVTVTVGGKTLTATVTARPAPEEGEAVANTAEAFAEAMKDPTINTIIVSGDLGEVKVTRDISVEGNLRVSKLTVNENATLTMTDGRIFSDGILTISGGGKIVATAFTSTSGERTDHAAIYAGGKLTIGGTDIDCYNIASTGDIDIFGGATVNVYGNSGAGANGVHASGKTVTISGEGTKVNVVYNKDSYGKNPANGQDTTPAAFEVKEIVVDDKATLYVYSAEGCKSWKFAVWSGTSGSTVTVKGGAYARFDVSDIYGKMFDGISSITVESGSRFVAVAPEANWQKDIVVGLGEWYKSADEVPDAAPSLTAIKVTPPDKVKYLEGETLDLTGMTVTAVYGTNEVAVSINDVTVVPAAGTALTAKDTTVTVTYNGKTATFSIAVTAASASATVTSESEFNTALADPTKTDIAISGDFTISSATIDRNVSIRGNLKVTSLTVSDGVTLTMVDGRILSDGDLTISGGGTIDALAYGKTNASERKDLSSIYAGGKLTIDGTTVESNGVYTVGDIEVKGGADVTVYGKNVYMINTGNGANGIHIEDGTLTVSGSETVLRVLYDDAAREKTPAAFQTGNIVVDGAELYVGNTEGSTSWAYATWLNGNSSVTAKNGAYVRFEVMYRDSYGGLFNNTSIVVDGTDTRFIVIAPEADHQKGIATGNVEWYTSASQVPSEGSEIEKIEITKQPNKTTYTEGDKLDLTGMEIVAVYDNGSKVNVPLTEVTTSVSTDVPLTTSDTEITVTYAGEFTAKFTITVNAKETSATVSSEEAFKAALESESIANITVEGDVLELTEAVNVDRDLTIAGNVKFVAPATSEETTALAEGGESAASDGVTLTVAEGKTLTVNGYLRSDVGLTISGTGKVVVNHAADTADDRNELASIYVNGALTIDGADADVYNIAATGDIAVKGGAVVNVYGKKAIAGSNIANGIHASGKTINVSGEGTVLSVLYNAADYAERPGGYSGTPAAFEAMAVVVDGATLNVGSGEECASWSFGIWSNTSGANVTAKNRANVKFDVPDLDNEVFSGVTVSADEDSRFVVVTAEEKFDKEAVTAGLVEWYTPEQEVPDSKPAITGIKVVTQPTTLVYDEGDTFDPTGIVVKAVYGESGQESADVLTGMTYEPSGALSADDTTVKVKYGEFETTITITVRSTATSASVSNAEEFATALANASIVNITITGDFTVDNATITRNITIYGSLKVKAFTVNENATLTMADGRIVSDGDLTISGSGKIVATAYEATNVSARKDLSSIYAGGKLTIDGTTVKSNGIYTVGNIEIKGGADVTSYGKNVYVGGDGANGIHSESGTVTVSGAETVLNVLYDDAARDKTPAAFQAATLAIDGATVNVGSTDGSASWGYAVWSDGNFEMTVTNGAQVKFDVDASSSDSHWGSIVCSSDMSGISIKVSEGTSAGETTSFVVETSAANGFDINLVKEGQELVTVSYPGSESAEQQAA